MRWLTAIDRFAATMLKAFVAVIAWLLIVLAIAVVFS